MEGLDLAIRTLWQEFFEASLKRRPLERRLKNEGTFTRKRVKGKEYWYKQRYHRGKITQEYYGPRTTDTDEQVSAFKKQRLELQKQIREMGARERQRGSLLKRAGFPVLDSPTASVLENFLDLGLLDDGILVGSHAFAAYSGLLGGLFESDSLKTLDIDLVPETSPGDEDPIDLIHPGGILSLHGKPFHAVPGLSNKELPFAFVGPDGLRIDFLAPMRGKPRGIIPVRRVSRLGAQTLPFLDFLLKNPVQGALIAPNGGIPVMVPEPARFAVHKLIVAHRRNVTSTAKKAKDLAQATQLIEACSVETPDELKSRYREAVGRGKKWKLAIEKSLARLPQETMEKISKS